MGEDMMEVEVPLGDGLWRGGEIIISDNKC